MVLHGRLIANEDNFRTFPFPDYVQFNLIITFWILTLRQHQKQMYQNNENHFDTCHLTQIQNTNKT